VFTPSAITPPEVNRFGWNLGHSEYIVCRWPWQILGAIRAEARERGDFFCPVNNARRYRFPISFTKFAHRTWICVAMNPFEHDFENLPAKGLFQKKANFWRKFSTTCDFRPRYPKRLQITETHYSWPVIPLDSRHRERRSLTSLPDACRLVLETWGRIIPRLHDTTGCQSGLTKGCIV